MEYHENDIEKLVDILNEDKPIFVNRLGGSDFDCLLGHLYSRNFNFDNQYTRVCEYNGYYDIDNNSEARKSRFVKFLSELDRTYRENPIATGACRTLKHLISVTENGDPIDQYHQKYFSEMDLEFWNYHVIFENIDNFIKFFNGFAENKKILIVSPFVDSIKRQIEGDGYFAGDRELVNCEYSYLKTFVTYYDKNKGILNSPHSNFSETVEYYKNQLNDMDFDIALLSCGSYSHFIGDHIKSIGRKAIYVGGILQLLWGVMGNRWLERDYARYYDLSKCVSPGVINFTRDKKKESLNDYMNTDIILALPSNFNWEKYLQLNPSLGVMDEIHAKNHYIMKGRNSGLSYK